MPCFFVIGHKSYEPGTHTYQQVLSAFGHDLVTPEGYIDRRRLASHVFSQKASIYFVSVFYGWHTTTTTTVLRLSGFWLAYIAIKWHFV